MIMTKRAFDVVKGIDNTLGCARDDQNEYDEEEEEGEEGCVKDTTTVMHERNEVPAKLNNNKHNSKSYPHSENALLRGYFANVPFPKLTAENLALSNRVR